MQYPAIQTAAPFIGAPAKLARPASEAHESSPESPSAEITFDSAARRLAPAPFETTTTPTTTTTTTTKRRRHPSAARTRPATAFHRHDAAHACPEPKTHLPPIGLSSTHPATVT
jgi:hypothetical protein